MKERGHIEQLWREEKYHVLLHSYIHFLYSVQLTKHHQSFVGLDEVINSFLKHSLSFILTLIIGGNFMKERGHIEQLWREEKYHVLLHSQQSYQMIR
jgi:hypothetical protein